MNKDTWIFLNFGIDDPFSDSDLNLFLLTNPDSIR